MKPVTFTQLAREVLTYTVHAFGAGQLSQATYQFGTSGACTSTDTWKVIDTKNIIPFVDGDTATDFVPHGFGTSGRIIEVKFYLQAHAHWSSTDGTGGVVTYAWQAKDMSATSTDSWVWLTPTSSGLSTSVGTSATSTAGETPVLQGYMSVSSTFSKVPFSVRLLVIGGGVGADTDGGSSTGAYIRAMNSSYVTVIYRVE